MKRLILLLCLSVVIGAVHVQTGRLDLKLPQGHPRYLTTQEGTKERGSRKLMGITIQLSNSEEKELFIRYSMQIGSE